MAHLEPRQPAGDEEADRPEHVGDPHEAMGLGRVQAASMAANVVTLKNTVPTSCTALADQSMRPGSQVQKRSALVCPRSAARAVR